MRVAICGSMAFDTIMVFEGRFQEHILPDQVHILNVSFLVPGMRREFGGCAGNIAYNLKLLGGDPVPVATVGGDDAGVYFERFADLGIDTRCVRPVPGSYTAQAFITTDKENNQITAFHPGAMAQSHMARIADAGSGIGLGIVGPDGKEGMVAHAREFLQAGIPFVFDPGQALPLFSGDELLKLIDAAEYLAVNDYEGKLVQEKTGLPLDVLARRVKALVVTKGAEGSEVLCDGERIEVPCVQADAVVDPTGCGDAYRGGLLYGLANGLDWSSTARLSSLMGALKIARQGGQNHAPTQEEISQRFLEAWGYRYE